MNSGNL